MTRAKEQQERGDLSDPELKAGQGAEAVDIPADVNVVATYPIALIQGAADNEVARAFLEYFLSEEGRQILGDYGFTAPRP